MASFARASGLTNPPCVAGPSGRVSAWLSRPALAPGPRVAAPTGLAPAPNSRRPATTRAAAGQGNADDPPPPPRRGPLGWTPRERWVVAGLALGACIFGPRLLLLGAVALERGAVALALGLERLLSTAFLSAFSLLAAGAGVALAGAAVYFFVLEEGRLGAGARTSEEDEWGDDESD